MDNNQSHPTEEALSAIYAATVDYHNNLVQTRFTVAGLVFAATGFLIGAFLQARGIRSIQIGISILGIVTTFICWLLEVRNYQLLENLSSQGKKLQSLLGINKGNEEISFFTLMNDQPIGPRLIPTRIRLSAKQGKKSIFRHTVISLLYLLFLLLWIISLFVK